MQDQKTEQECCPRFDPIPWEDKIFEWDKKRFIKDHVFTFFYMPVNFGPVIRRMPEESRRSRNDTRQALPFRSYFKVEYGSVSCFPRRG